MTNARTPLSPTAIHYAISELLNRAGIDDNTFDLAVQYAGVVYGNPRATRQIQIATCAPEAWDRVLVQRPHSLHWLAQEDVVPRGEFLPFAGDIPVLFWGAGAEDGYKPFAVRAGDTITLNADIVATTFFMLTRWEEIVNTTRDAHDRFPAGASVAARQGFLDQPIVDEYALILRSWLQVLFPDWEPARGTFAVKLTHDIDSVHHFRSWQEGARTAGCELLKKRDIRLALQIAIGTIQPTQAARYQDIFTLADISAQYQLDSAFFFMASEPGGLNNDYDVAAPLMRKCIASLRRAGFEIGIHTSYDAYDDIEKLYAEKTRLDAILESEEYGGRQHYLRFRVPDTWRNWERVGLTFDSTLGYPEHPGFRCGTCHPFCPFDIEEDRVLKLWELPLIAADTTLRDYRHLSPAQGKEMMLALARKCQQLEGTFTLLWHNSSLSLDWEAWRGVYEEMGRELAEM